LYGIGNSGFAGWIRETGLIVIGLLAIAFVIYALLTYPVNWKIKPDRWCE